MASYSAHAESFIQQPQQLDATEPADYLALARAYEQSGDYVSAEATLVKAQEMRPTDPAVSTQLASFYSRRDAFDKSMEVLQARADREPNNPEAFSTIATFYWDKANRDFRLSDDEKMRHVQLGLAAVEKALSLNSQYVEAMVYKSLLLLVQANLERDPARQQMVLREVEKLKERAAEIGKQNAAPEGR